MSETLPLRVLLAGYNVDADTLAGLAGAAYDGATPPPREAITPETVSAAYARISRNPADVWELRARSRVEVEKARKSNENIVFGLGHSSVAEHACFNLDVVGISRLAVEAVERHRLASFTEKSQRYIKLDGDFVLPPEIEEAGLAAEFRALIERQNAAYFELYPALKEYFTGLHRDAGLENPEKAAKGNASEDARYVVGLATRAQFGMTVNARTLETMLRDGFAHPLAEVRAFAGQLGREVHGLAPSLIKYVDATGYERAQFARQAFWPSEPTPAPEDEVALVDYDRDGEHKVLAAILMHDEGLGWKAAKEKITAMGADARAAMVDGVLRPGAQWDPPPREFELAQYTFEIALSAAAFGQLKRHRMASVITGPYDGSLGWTVPDSVREVGMVPLFDGVMEASFDLAGRIAAHHPAAAPYALTNAHRRRVVFQCNARELYHVSRLREDLHAQWDIRRLAGMMVAQAREATPTLLRMAVGKHAFTKRHTELFGSDEDA